MEDRAGRRLRIGGRADDFAVSMIKEAPDDREGIEIF
jgi:hypothetical protein